MQDFFHPQYPYEIRISCFFLSPLFGFDGLLQAAKALAVQRGRLVWRVIEITGRGAKEDGRVGPPTICKTIILIIVIIIIITIIIMIIRPGAVFCPEGSNGV